MAFYKASQQLEGISQTKGKKKKKKKVIHSLVTNKTINHRLGMRLDRGIIKTPPLD